MDGRIYQSVIFMEEYMNSFFKAVILFLVCVFLGGALLAGAEERDVNGLQPGDYDKQGWAVIDGQRVASPDGALVKGEEDKNLSFAVTGVINRMTDEEKGMIMLLLTHGNKLEEKAEATINSLEKLREYGRSVDSSTVTSMLEGAFAKGTGFMDSITGRDLNYGKQLDLVIKDVLVKAFKVPMPKFSQKADTLEGAIQRETWIVEMFTFQFLSLLHEDDQSEFAVMVSRELAAEGISLGTSAAPAFAFGALATTRKALGFKFHIFMAKAANYLARFITGKGLSFSANWLLQSAIKKIVGTAFPILAIVLTVQMLYDLPGIINPRDYDKFIPAVLMIGIGRISQESGG
jgi:hypothetical protein